MTKRSQSEEFGVGQRRCKASSMRTSLVCTYMKQEDGEMSCIRCGEPMPEHLKPKEEEKQPEGNQITISLNGNYVVEPVDCSFIPSSRFFVLRFDEDAPMAPFVHQAMKSFARGIKGIEPEFSESILKQLMEVQRGLIRRSLEKIEKRLQDGVLVEKEEPDGSV